MGRATKPPLICLCNGVPQDRVEQAIRDGCTSLGRLFDETSAGVGACGGSCQPVLRKMLEAYRQTGGFPADPRPPERRRGPRR